MLKRNGQNLTEYAIIIAVAIAAIVGMQGYVKRGLQAKHKDAAEYAISYLRRQTGATAKEMPLQYEPDYIKSDYVTTENSRIRSTLDDGDAGREIVFDTTSRTGTYEILPVDPTSEKPEFEEIIPTPIEP